MFTNTTSVIIKQANWLAVCFQATGVRQLMANKINLIKLEISLGSNIIGDIFDNARTHVSKICSSLLNILLFHFISLKGACVSVKTSA